MLANRPRWFAGLDASLVFDDVVRLDPAELLDRGALEPSEADLLHGGPPCTPFSKSGYWLEQQAEGADPKASLLDSYVEILAATRPKSFLMENVYGLAYRNQNRPVLNRFLHGVREAGYVPDFRILLAADYGVPQLRQRLIRVGMREDVADDPEWKFPWPQATHAGPHETRKGRDDTLPIDRTVAEALRRALEENPSEPQVLVAGTYAEELAQFRPARRTCGGRLTADTLDLASSGDPATGTFCSSSIPTGRRPRFRGSPDPGSARFTGRTDVSVSPELKRLMTFPDDFVVTGNRREQQLELGNAVPPLLGRVVADALASGSSGGRGRAPGARRLRASRWASHWTGMRWRSSLSVPCDLRRTRTKSCQSSGSSAPSTWPAAPAEPTSPRSAWPCSRRRPTSRIDALTVKRKVSANAYSMRGAAAVLAGNASLYGYHLGVTGPEPLNNQPWFHGVDRPVQGRGQRGRAVPEQPRPRSGRNGYDSPRALMALAAFIRVRQKLRRSAWGRTVEPRGSWPARFQPAREHRRGVHPLEPRGREARPGARRGRP